MTQLIETVFKDRDKIWLKTHEHYQVLNACHLLFTSTLDLLQHLSTANAVTLLSGRV